MKIVYAAAAALLFFANSAIAQHKSAGVYAEGTTDCGQWIESRQSKTSQVLESYVLGTLNGLAMGNGGSFGARMDSS